MRYAKFLIVLALLGAGALAANAVALSDPGFAKNTAIEIDFGDYGTVDSALSTKTDTRAACGDTTDGNGHVVWFAATAPSTGSATADTYGSTYDTVLSVYERGKYLACDDDGGGYAGPSVVTFDVVAGKKYYFKVATYSISNPGGVAFLNLSSVTT